MLTRRPRILTIGHSYVVALNRRLAREIANCSHERWDVTVVSPSFVRGDLRPIAFETDADAPDDRQLSYRGIAPHAMAYMGLRSVLAQHWDLVHCWEEPYVLAAAQIAALTRRDTALITVTAQNVSKQYPPPFNWLERFTMRRAAGWICFGVTSEDVLMQHEMYARRAHRIIPMGVDIDTLRPDRAAREVRLARLEWRASGPPVVGFLGRFVPEKGIRVLMQALDALPRDSWRALFVGDGPLREEMAGWATAYGDRVRIATGVPHDEVGAHLNAMDVLCAPSLTTPRWREQFGRMLIEAFACGTPVIASDSGEIPYVVGDAGVIAPEGDAAAWAAAIADLIESPHRRADFARRGIQRACDRFAWPCVARQHLDFFEEVLSARTESSSVCRPSLVGEA